MKKSATQPWESHLVHVPGIMALKADDSVFACKSITTFSPKAYCLGYLSLKEDAISGDPRVAVELEQDLVDAGACAALARAATPRPRWFLGQTLQKGRLLQGGPRSR